MTITTKHVDDGTGRLVYAITGDDYGTYGDEGDAERWILPDGYHIAESKHGDRQIYRDGEDISLELVTEWDRAGHRRPPILIGANARVTLQQA